MNNVIGTMYSVEIKNTYKSTSIANKFTEWLAVESYITFYGADFVIFATSSEPSTFTATFSVTHSSAIFVVAAFSDDNISTALSDESCKCNEIRSNFLNSLERVNR